MGYLDGFGVTLRKMLGVHTDSGRRVTHEYPEEVRPKPARFHGRHVLNRYEDGMEKCIGCELCAGVCPARCIYVRGRDNDPEDPTSPGERYGYVYEINYLRCIHCDLCVDACPTEAITETKMFEFAFTNRSDAIYTKDELLVDDDGQPRKLPWEHWEGGFDPAADTSGWMRATAPAGDADFIGLVAWAGELGYGVRPAEQAADVQVPAVPPPAPAGDDGPAADGDGAHGTFDHDGDRLAPTGAAADVAAPEGTEPVEQAAPTATVARAPGEFDLRGEPSTSRPAASPTAPERTAGEPSDTEPSDTEPADAGPDEAAPADAAPDAAPGTGEAPSDGESTDPGAGRNTGSPGPQRGMFDAPDIEGDDAGGAGRGRRWRKGGRR